MAPTLLASALLTALVLTAAPAPAHAGTASAAPLEISRVRGGAIATDPIANGRRVYIPTGRVLATWDYTNPSAPLRVSTSAPAGGAINGLARRGNYLYASWRGHDGTSGVATYSLNDPAAPKLVNQLDNYIAGPDKFAIGLVVANDHLYLFDINQGLFVANLANPAAPVFTRTAAGVSTEYSKIVAHGNMIHGTGRNFIGTTVLDIFDVSNPAMPVQRESFGTDGIDTFSLVTEPQLAIGVGNRLSLFDLSAPGQMTRRGFLDIPPAFAGAHVGNYAYTFGWGPGLDVWNVANIDAPTAAGHVDMATFSARRAMQMGTTLLIPTETDYVHAIDTSTPSAPKAISSGWLPGGVAASDAAMHNGQLVLLNRNFGLTLNDANTLAPATRFDVDLPESLEARSFEKMAVSGDMAYLASWGAGLIAVDLTDPAAPHEVGRLGLTYAAVLDVKGSYAYVGKWTNGGLLGVVDISNPATPTLVWQGELVAQPYRLKVNGQYAYIAEGGDTGSGDSGGLRVYSLADPANPVQVAQLNDGCDGGFDLAIDSAVSLAYLACPGGMQVIDIANPAAPVVVGRYTAASHADYTRVEQRGDRAWFANLDGLQELDVSDPTAPVLLKTTSLGHQTPERMLALDDGRLLVLGGGTGVHVFGAAGSGDVTSLRNGGAVSVSGAAGREQVFSIDVPAGVAMLEILSYGNKGDIALLAKRNAIPTPATADGRSDQPGSGETIRFNHPAAGTYYIKVIGNTAFKGIRLQARLSVDAGRSTPSPKRGASVAVPRKAK